MGDYLETVTCNCGNRLKLYYVDFDIWEITPLFQGRKLINYCGEFPETKEGVILSGYWELICKKGCYNTFEPAAFFGLIVRLEQIREIKKGISKGETPGTQTLFSFEG